HLWAKPAGICRASFHRAFAETQPAPRFQTSIRPEPSASLMTRATSPLMMGVTQGPAMMRVCVICSPFRSRQPGAQPRPRSALSRSDCRGCALNMGIDELDCHHAPRHLTESHNPNTRAPALFLFQATSPSVGDLSILLGKHARNAYRANNLAIDQNRNASLVRNRSLQPENSQPNSTPC